MSVRGLVAVVIGVVAFVCDKHREIESLMGCL